MTENERHFCNMLYDSMVRHHFVNVEDDLTEAEKIKRVKDYLNRVYVIEKGIFSSAHSINEYKLLKAFYHDRYVIKKRSIPESYYQQRERRDFENGYGNVTYDEKKREEIAKVIISDQKKSLDKWIDYFFCKDSNYYPYELKFWAFQGMLKMGNYDKEKERFKRRGRTTVSPFIELDHEALSLCMNAMAEYLNGAKVDDLVVEELLRKNTFSKLYEHYYREVRNDKKKSSNNDGKWIKYDRGSDFLPLVESIDGKGTGWCTVGGKVAKSQLEKGDFYVYYTKDEKGNYCEPRLAIRMEGPLIAEIRGIANEQNVEADMERVLEEKLKEFPDAERYYKKISDMKRVTEIYEKFQKEELENDDLRFIYQLDGPIEGFGYGKDPRITEIIASRKDKRKDLANILECSEDEVALSYDELLEKRHRCVCLFTENVDDHCDLDDLSLPKLRYVIGNFAFKGWKLMADELEVISGDARLESLEDSSHLSNLRVIGGVADFNSLRDSKGLEHLTSIGGNATFNCLKNARSLINLKYIGGIAEFGSLEDSQGLDNLTMVNRGAFFNCLKNATGLKSLKIIGKNAYFRSLSKASGLENLRFIGENAYFNELEDARGLNNLEIIGKTAFFDKLTNIGGLNKLHTVGNSINFGSLIDHQSKVMDTNHVAK